MRISTVIPLYNHADYIDAAINSVLSQMSSADEIIVLDDGSTDTGPEKARRALAGHSNARVLQQTNAGAHTTINRLFEMASGDYVAILNSDDLFVHGKLDRCRQIFAADPAIDLIVGEARIIDKESKIQKSSVAADWMRRALAFRDAHGLLPLSLLHENWVATTSNMVIAKAFWCRAGGFRNLRYCHDLDFLMTACTSGCVHVDRGAAHIQYRVHSRNTIGEDLDKIRLEIAAVWANTLFEARSTLVDGIQSPNVGPFVTALESKGLSLLICFLQLMRADAVSAPAFYDATLRGAMTHEFLKYLR